MKIGNVKLAERFTNTLIHTLVKQIAMIKENWIPVDVLPPMRCTKHNGKTFPVSNMSDYVLVCTNYKMMYVGYYRFNGENWVFDDNPAEDEIVTHWMHLPSPPEAKNVNG